MSSARPHWLLPAAYCLILFTAAAAAAVDEPHGYRLDDFRAHTPATLEGATVVTTAEAERLWRAGSAAFVDVLSKPPKPANLPAGTIWRDPERQDIPG